jgi:hypothetical protein
MERRRPSTRVGLTEEKVRAALIAADGSPTRAARMLGVGRGTIIYWMNTRNIVIKRHVEVA